MHFDDYSCSASIATTLRASARRLGKARFPHLEDAFQSFWVEWFSLSVNKVVDAEAFGRGCRSFPNFAVLVAV